MANFTISIDIYSLSITSNILIQIWNIVITVESRCNKTTCYNWGKKQQKAMSMVR